MSKESFPLNVSEDVPRESSVEEVEEVGGEDGSEEEQPQEKKTNRSAFSGRTAQAIALATTILTGSPSLEAKRPRHHARSHSAQRAEAARPVPPYDEKLLDRVSLNSNHDRGLKREVKAAELLKLGMFETEEDIKNGLEDGTLVSIYPTSNDSYVLDAKFGEVVPNESKRLYASLLKDVVERFRNLTNAFYQKFHRKLVVSSALRTKDYVDQLRKVNPNVAHGYTSTHIRGTTVDFIYRAYKNESRREDYEMTEAEKEWLSAQLIGLEAAGVAQATMETNTRCLHVMFYPTNISEEKKREIAKTLNEEF